MPGSYTAVAMRDEFLSEMKQRFPALAFKPSFGTSGEADLLIGAGTAGTDSMFIRFATIASIQKDVLGLQQTSFKPHVAQIVIEANPAAGAGGDVGTWATRFQIFCALAVRGTRVELYEVTNTTAPSVAGIAAGNLKASYETSLQYPMMASI